LPFQGPKYNVNVDTTEWESAKELGFPSYKSVSELPGEIDYVIISVPAQVVPLVLKDCIEKGVYAVHLYTAGYGETGTELGSRLEDSLEKMAKDSGIKLVGPNCIGLFNPRIGVGMNLGGYQSSSGRFGFISHSGSQSSGVTRTAWSHGIMASKVISMGNGLILDTPDYLDYFSQDDDTSVIGMYVEGVRNGRKFFSTLKEVCRKKPVVVWKVGETEEAGAVVEGHSTSKATRPEIWDAMLRQCGAIKVDNIESLLETTKLLLHLPNTTGKRLGLLALSGGHSTEMANVFSKAGFQIPQLSEHSYTRILKHWDVVGSTYRNPLEGRTLSNPVNMNNVLDVLNEDDDIDIIVQEINIGQLKDGNIPVFRGHDAGIFCQFKERAKKPYIIVISSFLSQSDPVDIDTVYQQFLAAGIPAGFGFRATAEALNRVITHFEYQNE
jgi:acyl-CoA synthetase (NDP forming)